ncbi:phytoene desaturase family protein [Paenibacillus sp. CAU 1782]
MVGKRVAVIGAGPGGLAAGMLLSSQGYKVTVYEKQDVVGGRTSRFQLGDYQFDRGATFLMMPWLLEELFHAAGRELHDYVKMVELDPMYRLQFGDISFEATRDREKMVAEIEQHFPGNGEGYLRFLREEGEKFKVVKPLLQRPFSKISDLFSADVFAALPKLHATDTVYNRLSRYFNDERLISAFTFQAKYLGMSPWNCPGTFTILSYLEHQYGLFHPIGGVNRICQAMADIIGEFGGEIALKTGVDKVLSQGGKAIGVQLENGEKVHADHVVINADFATAMSRLFQPGQLKKYSPVKLAAKKYSCSAFMLYLGLNREIDMPHHTILFAKDYRRNADELTRSKVLSKDASIYVHNPSVNDPTLAPPGKTALYVLMPVPNLTGGTDWLQEQEAVKEFVIDRLEQEPGIGKLRDSIEVCQSLTPLDWRDSHDVYQGATFNLAHSLDQMLLLRPHNRFQEMANCWLVGGGTHPGSGLPTIFESARISARLILEQDQGKKSSAAAHI